MPIRATAKPRLPQIAFCGVFQGGKSLIVNAILGAPVVPVGRAGFRTTPCVVRCQYGDFARALVHEDDGATVPYNLANLADRFHSNHGDNAVPRTVEIACCHPILEKLTLIDTPGVDHSEADDESAIEAAQTADAIVLVAQQGLPMGTRSFSRLLDCFTCKPWALIFNCGRAGGHLVEANSRATREVESECLRQLESAGLQSPVFSMRISTGALLHYLHVHPRSTRMPNWDLNHEADVRSDEISVRGLRDNLIALGETWLQTRLTLAEKRFVSALARQEWDNPGISFEPSSKAFRCTVGCAGRRYTVTGTFRHEETARQERIVLQDFQCRESWVVDRLKLMCAWQKSRPK